MKKYYYFHQKYVDCSLTGIINRFVFIFMCKYVVSGRYGYRAGNLVKQLPLCSHQFEIQQ